MREKEQIDQKKKDRINEQGKKIIFLGRESYVKQFTLLKSAQIDWEVLFDIDECKKEFPVHHSHCYSSRTLTSTLVVCIVYNYTGFNLCCGSFNERSLEGLYFD